MTFKWHKAKLVWTICVNRLWIITHCNSILLLLQPIDVASLWYQRKNIKYYPFFIDQLAESLAYNFSDSLLLSTSITWTFSLTQQELTFYSYIYIVTLLHVYMFLKCYNWLSISKGATYIRWGRKTCPVANGTSLIYSGKCYHVSSRTTYIEVTSSTYRCCKIYVNNLYIDILKHYQR